MTGAPSASPAVRAAASLGPGAGDPPAEIEHGHLVGEPHDERHVVLDQDDRQAEPLAQRRDRRGHRFRLGRVHPRDWLVEQQQVGLGAHGAGELDAFAVAVGELVHGPLEVRVEPEQRGHLAHARDLLMPFAACRRHRQAGGREAGVRQPVTADEQVLRDGRAVREREVLERAADPEAGDPVRAQRVDPRVAVADLAGGGAADAGEHVQTRRFAGAVRADDRVGRPGLNVERDVAQRSQAAEAHGDVAGAQCQGGGRPVVARRAASVPRTSAEVAATDFVAGRQRGGVTLERDAPDLQHACAVGDPQRHRRVLLDEHDRRPAAIDLPDDLGDLVDDLRRQPQRWLVEQQQLRAGHQRAADRDHLLLAARQQPGRLGAPLAQAREHVEHRLELAPALGAGKRRATGAQVLLHGQPREDATALGHLHDPGTHDLCWPPGRRRARRRTRSPRR